MFVKMFSDADASVRKFAEFFKRPLTPEFAVNVGDEIHQDFNLVLKAVNAGERIKAYEYVKNKYKGLDTNEVGVEMRLLKEVGQAVKLVDSAKKNPKWEPFARKFLEDKVAEYSDLMRPKAGIEAEKGGQTLYQGDQGPSWLDRLHSSPVRAKGMDVSFDAEVRRYFSDLRNAEENIQSSGDPKTFAADKKRIGEIVDEAQRLYDEGDVKGAIVQSEKALSLIHERSGLQHGPRYILDQLEEKQTLLQDPADPRGFIRFTPRETIIGLVKADASTFVHESAHFWLKDMHDFVRAGKADAKYLSDWGALAKWLDVKEGQTKLTKEQQETFARGFEAYLREGKSPSLELKSAFRLFRRWLTKLYREFNSLNVTLTDDVRSVMDRMVASEDEIDAARRELGYDREPAAGEVTSAERAKMDAARDEARQSAVEALLGAQMKELSPEHKEFLKREYQRAEHAATEQAEGLQVYRSMDEIGKAFKETDGQTPDARGIAGDYRAGKLSDNERTAFDLLAERQGYGSGDEMAKDVLAARDLKDEVASRIEIWMSQFKDARSLADSFREEAMRVAHNAAQEELAVMEHQVFMDKADQAREEAQDAGKPARRPFNARMDARIVRERAKVIISKRPVRRAGDYTRYFTAERRNAEESARAAATRDFDKAAEFKRKQLFNHALAMESLKARDEIRKIERYLAGFAGRKQDLKDMSYGFVNQIDRLLADRKLAPDQGWDQSLARLAREMKEAEDPPDVIANNTGMIEENFRWRPETLPEMVKRIRENCYDIAVPDSIINGRPNDYKWMSLSDFRDLRTAVQALASVGRGYDRLDNQFTRAGIKEAALAIRTSIEANIGAPYEKRRALGHPDSTFLENWEKWTSRPGDRFLDMVNLVTLCRYLDGGKDTGPMADYVYRILTTAENDKRRMTREMTDAVNDLLGKHFVGDEFKRLGTEKVHFDFLPKERQNLTREEMISIALNTGNEGNLSRLMFGEGLMPENVRTILDSLTKKEMDFVQATWDYLETFWPKVMELEMRTVGVQPEKVVPTEVVSRHGRYRGGYYPISYDYERSAEAYKHAEQLNELFKQFGSASAHTLHGHTQRRMDKVGRQLNLSMDVLFRHLENVVHDLSFRKSVIDVNRVLRERDVREAVANALGTKGMKAIEGALKAVASDQGEFLDGLEKAVRWVRFRATTSRLGLKPVKMPGDVSVNLLLGIHEIGPVRMRRAMTGFVVHPKDTVAFVNERSERMLERASLRDRDLKDLAAKWKGKSTAKDVFFMTMSLADQAVSYPLWKEVYDHNLLTQGDKLARHIADETVTRTFGSGSVIDLSAVQRGGEYRKVLMWFYSWQNMMFNRMWLSGRLAGLQFDKKNYGAAAMTIASSSAMLWVLPGLIEGLYAQWFRNTPDRDDDRWKKRLLARVVEQGFGYIPGLRDVAGYTIDKSLGMHASLNTSLESAITTYVDPLAELVRSMSPDYELPERFWEHATSAGLQASGIPQQVGMMMFNFIDWLRDRGELTWRDMLTRRTKR